MNEETKPPPITQDEPRVITMPPNLEGVHWESIAVQLLTSHVSRVLLRLQHEHNPNGKCRELILTAGTPDAAGQVIGHTSPTLLVNGQADIAPPAVITYCNKLNELTKGRATGDTIPWSVVMQHICTMNVECAGICGHGRDIRHIEHTWRSSPQIGLNQKPPNNGGS